MNIDIRSNVISKIKNDDSKDIINTVDEAITSKDELVLPGLGVLFEIFWDNLGHEEKTNIANTIIKNIK